MARSLDVLLTQVNARAPGRSRAADGSIGDPAHSSRVSDHNPDPAGVVRARDYTHDPAGGLDCQWLADRLVAGRDPRIKYVIWNRRILDARPGHRPWTWQPYHGVNPHTGHLHLSVVADGRADDPGPWALDAEEEYMPLTPSDTNAVWMQPCTVRHADGTTETHAAVEWLTVAAVRIAGLEAGMNRVLELLAADRDALDADELKTVMREAVRDATVDVVVTVDGPGGPGGPSQARATADA